MNSLSHKRILLGITGGIAAYKCAELVRTLTTLGAEVRVILTQGGAHFVSSETLSILSGHQVYQSFENKNKPESILHIELTRWAEIILIAPATANMIAKLAQGIADDLLSTLCLATNSPIILVPAMNTLMWSNSAVESNINLLKSRNSLIWGPDEGLQACGDTGLGRMIEIEDIIQNLNDLFSPQYLKHKKIMITAGPTQEAMDPVRYLTNYSSGKMGYALAEAALSAGAHVTLISGPVYLGYSPNISMIKITTALEMYQKVMENISDCDIFISAAAVSDYRFEEIKSHKIKKNQDQHTVTLIKNPDILSEISKLSQRPFTVGFAAETENLEANAHQKLVAKKLDMIIANLVGKNTGFQSDHNELLIITEKFNKKLNFAPKKMLARELLKLIESYYLDTAKFNNQIKSTL